MTAQPIEANVVLSADNSQYDQAMLASAGSTDNLGRSVDTLGQKIANLSKNAGRTLIGISVADVAVITSATAAWASYEKQMDLLRAQSAVLTRTQGQQTIVMKDYTTAVKGLRTAYGTTTTEAATLVQTLTKLTNVRQSASLKDLSKIFTEMSNATGESSDGLANSLLSLQRVMGTPVNERNTKKYADQFTYLAAQTQTSAQGLIEFTAQLAPMGKAAGMTQTQVTGFATAFAKSGQDGIGAASVFAKVTSDISKSVATGSPEIAHYANLIGVTNKKFKEMDGGERVVQILEKIGYMGRRGAVELDRMGLDGTRSMRSLAGVLNQPGGLRQAMGLAQEGRGSDATSKGSDAADGMTRQLAKLREQMKMTAEIFGGMFGPTLEKFVEGMTKALEITNKIVAGPLGQFVAYIMKAVAPLAFGAGLLLTFAGALLKVAAAFTLFRSSASYGVREGMHGGAGIARGPEGFIASGTGELGDRGKEIAKGGTWGQRWQYNAGQPIGRGLGAVFPGMIAGAQKARGWLDEDYTPGKSRGPGSYLAGGIGRGLEAFVNPSFDAMRFQDPTKRSQYLQQLTPWSRFADRQQLSANMGEVGLAQTQMSAVAGAQRSTLEDPLLTNAARAAKMDELKVIKEETSVRLASAHNAESATRASILATQINTKEVSNNSVGYVRATKAVAGTVAGGVGGVYGAGKALMQSPMGMPIAGMVGMGALSAMGVQSNALMMGAGGAMMGPWGAAAGFGAGAAIDITTSNKKIESSIASITDMADAAVKSGSGLNDLYDSVDKTQKSFDKTTESRSAGNMWNSPSSLAGAAWNWVSRNDEGGTIQQKDQASISAQRARAAQIEGAGRDLGKITGTKFQGTQRHQRKQIDDFMSGPGAAMLADVGIDPEDLIAARTAMIAGGPEARKKYEAMQSKISTGGKEMRDRSAGTTSGDTMLGSSLARQAIALQSNVGLLYAATNDIVTRQLKGGSSYLEILRSTEKTQANIGDDNRRQAELQAGAASRVQQALSYQQPLMSRAAGFQQTIATQQAIQGGFIGTPMKDMTEKGIAALDASKTAVRDAFAGQASQIQQALLMQDQYELNRSRAQESYTLQRGYQEHDYALQRSRAEDSYNRQRKYSQEDYARSVMRSQFEFNLARTRQQTDFNHTLQVQAKQAAISSMDIYARVPTQRTASASWLLTNAGDQLQRLREMEKNLNELRKLGFSDNVIQQLRLTDPNNAQQLARFVTEVRDDPNIVRKWNRAAGQRVAAAGDISTDQSSLEWKEMRRGFNLQRARAADDFNRAQNQGRADFNRGLDRQKKEFGISMDQQAEDFKTQMNRQEHAYQITMRNAAQDLALMGKEISGTLQGLLTRGATELTGTMQKQAQAALSTFMDLKTSTRPVAIAIMKDLSEIFGFQYKVPKKTPVNLPGRTSGHPHTGGDQPLPNNADGGVIPGWTPGRDTTTTGVSGGEAVMRPEWTRAVGEKNIMAMNHRAKYGGFKDGGIYRPINAATSGRIHDVGTGYSAVDFAAPMGMPVYAVGSGVITRSGDIHGPLPSDSYHDARYGPYGSYGRVMYLKTDMGPEVLYAHLSQRGFGAGHRVKGGQPIAVSGSTGNSSGPHLHFGDSDGNPMEFVNGTRLSHGAVDGYAIAGLLASLGVDAVPAIAKLSSITKRLYKGPEASALAMTGMHPLDPGNISSVINAMAKGRYKQSMRGIDPNDQTSKWYGDGGVFTGPQGIGIGESGPEAVIPLNDQGAAFLATAIHGAEARGIGMGGTPMRGGMSVYNTRIDKSTNFTGAITVQANDPAELINKLQARQRVMALSRPSLTGSAA